MATRPPDPGSTSALNGAPAVGSPVPAVPAVRAVPATPLPLPLLLDEAMRWVRRHGRAIYPPIAVPAAVLSAGLAALQTVWQPPDAPVAADPLQSLASQIGR